jgi:hypothetical protein
MKKEYYEIVCLLANEMSARCQKITEYIPDEKDHLLRHIASASVHLALFAKDILNDIRNTKEDIPEIVKKFLNDCGCKT